jgi:hypothetical protein
MLLITIFHALITLDYYFILRDFYEAGQQMRAYGYRVDAPDNLVNPMFIFDIIILAALILECFCYFKVRGRIKNRTAALVHVSGLFLALLVPQALFMYLLHPGDELFRLIKKLQFFWFMSFMTIGHLAFVYLLTKGLSPKGNKYMEPPDSSFFD